MRERGLSSHRREGELEQVRANLQVCQAGIKDHMEEGRKVLWL